MQRTFTQLPSLECLILNGIPEVTDVVLTQTALSASLRELSISHCARVTDSGLRALARGCPHLQVLRVDEVSKIGSPGVLAIAEHCKELRVRRVFAL